MGEICGVSVTVAPIRRELHGEQTAYELIALDSQLHQQVN